MPVPCELAVRAVIPALRALIARELYDIHHLKQPQIAMLLHVTQSAVSQYIRGLRGRAIDLEGNPDITALVHSITSGLMTASWTPRQLVKHYCQACRIIRLQRLLCPVHRRVDPFYPIENCDVCMPPLCTRYDN
jgi:predicted transcriptional regulator